MTNEIKALLFMQVLDRVSDGIYPTESSHGESSEELERQIEFEFEEECDKYLSALADVTNNMSEK